MILIMNKKEVAAVALHMGAMRQSIRNKLKSNYGKTEMKEWLKAYDYVLSEARTKLESEQDENIFNLNIKDTEMLFEFIRAYQQKIEQDKQMVKALPDHFKEHLQLLTDVKNRCGEVMQIA